MAKSAPKAIRNLDSRHRDRDGQLRAKRTDTQVRTSTLDGGFRDSDKFVDANIRRFAHDAGKRAHDIGLDKRGSVMKQSGQYLVVEKRDGSVERLRPLPATTKAKTGMIFSKKR